MADNIELISASELRHKHDAYNNELNRQLIIIFNENAKKAARTTKKRVYLSREMASSESFLTIIKEAGYTITKVDGGPIDGDDYYAEF